MSETITCKRCSHNWVDNMDNPICPNCRTEIDKIDKHILALDKEKDKLIKKLTPKKTSGTETKFTDISIISLINQKTIRSIEDIESIISKLKVDLILHLNKHKNIRLK